ncbi:MAG: hypothetical protein GXO45_04610 [Aquificae bacterium]|nr:hypothetical protein [Aquificota bacterium]
MVKIGDKAPYFEYLEGIEGKNLYDLKQKYHIVIYKAEEDHLEGYEEDFNKANIKLIDYVQLLTKDFPQQFGLDVDKDFIILIDNYGIVQYVSQSVPQFKDIMGMVSFIEDEGCCAL